MAEGNTEEASKLINVDTPGASIRSNGKRCITVEPAVILMIIYLGGVMSLTQQYVYMLLKKQKNITVENENSSQLCKEGDTRNTSNFQLMNEVQKEASYTLASFNAVSLVPMLFSAVMLGSYSDKVGRKISLVFPLIGGCIKIVVVAIVIFMSLELNYFYIGIILEGFCGGTVLFLGGSFSYISDTTTTKERAFRIIVLEMCITFGVVISQLGVGYLIKYIGYLIPLLIILGCNLVNILYVVCFVQESVHLTDRQSAKFWTLDNHKRVFMLYLKDTTVHRRWKLQMSLFLLFLVVFADLGKADVTTLYALGQPFCFTSVLLGYFVAWSNLLPGICSTMFTKLLETRLTEMSFFIIGSVSNLINCVLTAVVSSTIWLFVGALFSSIAWVEQAAMVIGAVCLDSIYAATVDLYSGSVFFIIAAIYFLALITGSIVAVMEYVERRRQSQMESLSSPEESQTEDVQQN